MYFLRQILGQITRLYWLKQKLWDTTESFLTQVTHNKILNPTFLKWLPVFSFIEQVGHGPEKPGYKVVILQLAWRCCRQLVLPLHLSQFVLKFDILFTQETKVIPQFNHLSYHRGKEKSRDQWPLIDSHFNILNKVQYWLLKNICKS